MTNIHMHIFTMDHTPPIQLVYMVKDIVRSALPVWIPMQRIDEKRRLPVLSLIAPLLSPFVQARLDSFVGFLTSVSEIETKDLIAHETTAPLFTRGRLSLRRLVRYLRRGMKAGDTFEGVVIRLVVALYQINNAKVPKRQDQRSVLTAFLRSIADSTPYERIVVHTMDFDEAFRYAYNPGFPTPEVAGFDYRFPRLPFRRTTTEGEEPAQVGEIAAVASAASEIATEAGYERELTVLPFYCMDPRSYRSGAAAETALERATASGFTGVKIYSPLGYLPEDPRLAGVFDLCLANGLPVLAHCGRGGAGHKGAVNHSNLAHPYNWIPVLDRLVATYRGARLTNGPFRLCLAHFDSLQEGADLAWWDEIINLIMRYANSDIVSVYVDVSANHSRSRRRARKYFGRLSREVFGNPTLERRLLFGSDWWMQLYTVSETEYLHAYFERYAGSRYYPRPSGGETLQELFEANAREYLGRWY